MWYSLILTLVGLFALAQSMPGDILNLEQRLTVMKELVDEYKSGKLSYEKCMIKPSESCIIKENNPWKQRWAYDDSKGECVFIRWSTYCTIPKRENNFETKEKCTSECFIRK